MWKIPLSDIDIGEEEIEAVSKVLRSKWLSMGPVTEEFERRFAAYLGVKYAFAVSSCTAALHIAHVVLGAKAGDEVICPSLTFVATANSILYTGARPVFADIKSDDDLNIDPLDISRKITAKTKGITVVHYGGYPCDMDEIMALAKKNKLYVVEDAAHAPGAEYKGSKLGTIGDVGCYSFFANKNMTTGEGGMVVTDRDDLAEKIRVVRSHGMTSLTWDRHKGHSFSYDVIAEGYNYRISEITAALGIVQLDKLDENNNKRFLIAGLYKKKLLGTGLSTPFGLAEGKSSNHLFVILLPEEIDRLDFMKKMKEQGIQTSIHYPPVHMFTKYRGMHGNKEINTPITENVSKRLVTLPLHPLMSNQDVDFVASQVKSVLGMGG